MSAIAGTGFATSGVCREGRDYASRVAFIPPDAAVVLIQGGLNDTGAIAAVEAGATALLEAVSRRSPNARIVVVGPPLMPLRHADDVLAIDRHLRGVTNRVGVTYISTTDWNVPTRDDLHPTQAGHQYVARRLSEALGRSAGD